MHSDPVYKVRVVLETAAEIFRDCSAVQVHVRASKRLHKLEHITTSYIKFVCGGGEGSTLGRNDPSK